MNLYPAVKLRMGAWDYFVVKMSMRELAENVKFAHEIYNDFTLDEAIQRALNEGRVKTEIVTYLKRQPNRFFASIVIAAWKGDPKFYAIEIADDPQFEIFRDDNRLNNSFGVLRFDGTQEYYALDGQHRLAAMRALLDRNNPASEGAPEGIANDELSVIVVVPTGSESDTEFLRRYRRLFSNLNRYAKPMDQTTNIVLDEDDAFAILTRRLITEHQFFKAPGRQRDSARIKTKPGKGLSSGDPYFTSLETLYGMNETLLRSRVRQNEGWGSPDAPDRLEDFKRFRPEEEVLDSLYDELVLYWDGLLREIPELSEDPLTMRNHAADMDEEDGTSDSLLFWPIGQDMLADLARHLLDTRQDDPRMPTEESVKAALRGLGSAPWELHLPPWRFFLLTQRPEVSGRSTWAMRSEDRSAVVKLGRLIQMWALGAYDADADEEERLRIEWQSRLVPNQSEEAEMEMWKELTDVRDRIAYG